MPLPAGIVRIGGQPKSIGAGADGFYVGLFGSSELARLDSATGVLRWRAASGPGRTNGVTVAGTTVLTTNRDTGTVTLHDAATGVRQAILPVGGLPWGVSASGNRAYVANFASATLSVIDLAARRVVATVATADSPVTSVAGDDRVYVVHLDGTVMRLAIDGSLVARVQVGATASVAVDWDRLRHRLYVGSREGHLIALDAETLAEVGRIDLPGPAHGAVVNPETGRIFVVDAVDDRLFIVEPDLAEIGVMALAPQDDHDGGTGLAAARGRIAIADFASGTVSLLLDRTCHDRLTPTTTAPTRTPTGTPVGAPTPTSTPRPSPSPTPLVSATPALIRAKIERVWPHGGAAVREADWANITAYLMAPGGNDAPPCAWSPTVWLWKALNAEPARPLAIGARRMEAIGGLTFPVWDFNDVDVSDARAPGNKISFYVTVDGVQTLSNVWVHAVDARTIFPQQDQPVGVASRVPAAVDAKIEIVWPHGGGSSGGGEQANITALLFEAGTLAAIPPGLGWQPTVWLHSAVDNDSELPGTALPGIARTVTSTDNLEYLVYDFNDVDIRVSQDPARKLFFWLSVDDVASFTNIWAHGRDARSIVPVPDVLTACR